MSPFTKATAAALGAKGGKSGGKARAKAMTKAQRSKVAKLGGLARQAKLRAKKPK